MKHILSIITITRNDDCRLQEWYHHYLEYKDIVDLHIIVDNNSTMEYKNKMKQLFQNSIFIELDHNGGCTEAYNVGIRYATEHNADVISLMGNDIEIKTSDIERLLDILENEKFDMIYPIVLNNGDDIDRIDKYGYNVDYFRLQMKKLNPKLPFKDLPQFILCETGPGGCSFAKKSYYKTIGLQDTNLFMYADEVDNGIRASLYKMKVGTAKIVAWHRHIYTPGAQKRNHMAAYLLSRNHIYLAKKHLKGINKYRVYLITAIFAIEHYFHLENLLDKENRKYVNSYFEGLLAGLIGNMKNIF